MAKALLKGNFKTMSGNYKKERERVREREKIKTEDGGGTCLYRPPHGGGDNVFTGERGYTLSPEINTGSLPLVLSASCEPPFLARLRQSFVVSLVGSELTEMYKLAPPGLAKIHTWKTC